MDENAYLVSGRMIAEHGTTGFKPTDDYQFVGAMWMRTKSGWYYPKYPFGTSLLDAITVLLGKREWAFAVSPACTALAVLGMFFLARPIVGSFYALLAMIVLAMGPTTLQFSITPNSHAPALCFVVWGMCFLLRWWQSGRWQLGELAGLLARLCGDDSLHGSVAAVSALLAGCGARGWISRAKVARHHWPKPSSACCRSGLDRHCGALGACNGEHSDHGAHGDHGNHGDPISSPAFR